MSEQITTAFVKQFGSNIYHLSQQKGSRLSDKVRNETVKGNEKFFERQGTVSAQLRTTRHGDTPQLDTPHSRRRLTMNDYEWADLIDDQDKIRMLIDPTSDYAMAAVWAFGRTKDDVIISAISGNAYAGVDGGTTVALPTSRKIHAVASSALSALNVNALRLSKRKFDEEDIDEMNPRYFAINSSSLQSLLAETETTSSDYNTVKALVMGEIDTFLGFKFIRLERLVDQSGTLNFNTTTGLYDAGGTDANGNLKNLAWAKDGIILGTGEDIVTRISERDDKGYSTQVYTKMSIGATRMEEEKVLEVLSNN